MKCSVIFRNAALGFCLAAAAATASGADFAQDFSGGYSKADDLQSFMLAKNDAPASNAERNVASAAPAAQAEFHEPMFTLNKTHKYLGISTIIAAVATAATAPGEGCETNCPPPSQQPPRDRNGTHAHLARATVALAAATIATGILAHWDDIDLRAGITDPDNLHALLGITGALLMAAAVNKSAKSTVPVSHAGQAELGAALMAVGIKMVW